MLVGRALLGGALLFAAAGCIGSARPAATPPEYRPKGQTKCQVRASSDRPLVIEWPSSDRATLEAEAKHGLVVVKYSGCEMELMPQCHVAGSYRYTPTTRKLERVVISDEDELYAKLPVGAARLEATLAKSGQLVVNMNIVGRYDAIESKLDRLEGMCDGATHVVTGLTAGAFEFYAGASGTAGGGLGVAGVGAGGKSTSEREMLNRDGEAAACEASKSDDAAPPEGCGALLRVEVAPLGEFASLAPPPSAEPRGQIFGSALAPLEDVSPGSVIPPGDGIVRVHISSPDSSLQLQGAEVNKLRPVRGGFVSLGASTILCRAPCDTTIDARNGQWLRVTGPNITPSSGFQLYDRSGDVNLEVRPGDRTLMTLAVVGYSIGSLAVIGGGSVLLTGALVSSSDPTSSTAPGMVKWGAITLGAGAVLIGASLAVDLSSGSTRVNIRPGVPAPAE